MAMAAWARPASQNGRPDSLLRGVVDGHCTPRHGSFQRPQTKANWLGGSRRVRSKEGATQGAQGTADGAAAGAGEQGPMTPAGPRRPASAHSRPGRFALAVGKPFPPRPGSARVGPASRPFPETRDGAIAGKAAHTWRDNVEKAKKGERPKLKHGFTMADLMGSKPLNLKGEVVEEVNDVQERAQTGGGAKRSGGKNEQLRAGGHDAGVARTIHMLKRTLAERAAAANGTPIDSKGKKHATSMFKTCLKNPSGEGWPRPRTAGNEREPALNSVYELTKHFQALDDPIEDSDRKPDERLSAQDLQARSWGWYGRPQSPIVQATQECLMKDAARFEMMYDCHPEVDTVDLYAGPPSRSPTPSALLTCGSPPPSLTYCTRNSPSPILVESASGGDLRTSSSSPRNARPETPVVQYEQEALVRAPSPRPPKDLENPGRYNEPIRSTTIEPLYRSPTLGGESDKAVPPDRPPKFNHATIHRWFTAVAKDSEKVSRRELLFALNENEELFSVFCAVAIHQDDFEQTTSGKGRRSSVECGANGQKKFSQGKENFARRIAMMRKCMGLLDRIEIEYQERHGNLEVARTSRKSIARKSTRQLPADANSSARKIDFEVFLTYFKYQDMLLEYQVTPDMNWGFEAGSRKKSEIFRDCKLETARHSCLPQAGLQQNAAPVADERLSDTDDDECAFTPGEAAAPLVTFVPGDESEAVPPTPGGAAKSEEQYDY